jgi:quercetin dioxygenase-like cupin family protein
LGQHLLPLPLQPLRPPLRMMSATKSRRTSQAIPNIPGKSLIAVVVDYPPGGASVPHTHAKSSFI